MSIKDYDTEAEERERHLDQMRADIRLKTTQAAAEWPKVFTAIIIAGCALFGAAGALFGYALHR
jgi:hypothetical protein